MLRPLLRLRPQKRLGITGIVTTLRPHEGITLSLVLILVLDFLARLFA